jgi:excisionase family DNA binding protein
MNEILTIAEAAELLKMTPSQIYSMTRRRARVRMPEPIPFMKINSHIRFRRCDLERWLQKLASQEST